MEERNPTVFSHQAGDLRMLGDVIQSESEDLRKRGINDVNLNLNAEDGMRCLS